MKYNSIVLYVPIVEETPIMHYYIDPTVFSLQLQTINLNRFRVITTQHWVNS